MQDLWEGDMALTLAKNVPAGLHLYDTLTGEYIYIVLTFALTRFVKPFHTVSDSIVLSTKSAH